MVTLPASFAKSRPLVWAAGLLCLLTALPSFAQVDVNRSIGFMGQAYNLSKVEKINNGNALYFAPGHQNADQSTEEIIINFYERLDKNGKAITPDGLADAMLAQVKAEGATVIMPFKVPDPADKNRYIYYITDYLVYPQDGNGDIWLSKTLQSGGRTVGVLYKHQVDGANANAIGENAMAWLRQNYKQYSTALETVAIPERN
jgi:hypothetical protein